jgi:hypothetical protein
LRQYTIERVRAHGEFPGWLTPRAGGISIILTEELPLAPPRAAG